jgi:hypothetical protein
MGMQTHNTGLVPSPTTPRNDKLLGWVVGLLVVTVVGLAVVLVRLAAVQHEVDQLTGLVASRSDTVVVDDQVALDGCRLLGAIAAEQGISVTDVFNGGSLEACEAAAQEGAAAAR